MCAHRKVYPEGSTTVPPVHVRNAAATAAVSSVALSPLAPWSITLQTGGASAMHRAVWASRAAAVTTAAVDAQREQLCRRRSGWRTIAQPACFSWAVQGCDKCDAWSARRAVCRPTRSQFTSLDQDVRQRDRCVCQRQARGHCLAAQARAVCSLHVGHQWPMFCSVLYVLGMIPAEGQGTESARGRLHGCMDTSST